MIFIGFLAFFDFCILNGSLFPKPNSTVCYFSVFVAELGPVFVMELGPVLMPASEA
jgi:hypothetical protein